MSAVSGTMFGLTYSLLFLTYVFGVFMQTLPIPKQDWKAWGPVLMWDACIGELALGTVSAVQLIVNAMSNLLGTTFAGPFTSPTSSFALIMAQLVPIDIAIFLLISVVSATVVLAPVAAILASMLGPCTSLVTGSITLWSTVILVINLFPEIWVSIYVLGVCLFSVPFRLGRSLASYLISSSIVLAVGLPPMPSIALWLEGYIGYQGSVRPFQDIVSQMQTNPLAVTQLITTLPSAIGNLMAAVAIALVIFPVVYMFFLTTITRSLAKLIGGSSGGPMLTRFILMP